MGRPARGFAMTQRQKRFGFGVFPSIWSVYLADCLGRRLARKDASGVEAPFSPGTV